MDDKLTTKDAITVLRNLQDWLYFSSMNGGTSIQREAIDMGIGALKHSKLKQQAINSSDCIDRQAALDALRKMQTYKLFSGDDMLLIDQAGAMTELMLLPPAEPQIVRCKDCKHWVPYDWMFSEVWQSKNIADYPEDDIGCDCSEMAMKANDFCSRGERR